jgi:hypothetical protein
MIKAAREQILEEIKNAGIMTKMENGSIVAYVSWNEADQVIIEKEDLVRIVLGEGNKGS